MAQHGTSWLTHTVRWSTRLFAVIHPCPANQKMCSLRSLRVCSSPSCSWRHEQSLTAWLIRTTVRKAKRLGKVGARSGALEDQGREQVKDSPPSARGVTFEFDALLSALAVRDVDRVEVWRYAITMMLIGDEAAHVMAIHEKDDILFLSVVTVQGERFEVIRPPMSDETEQSSWKKSEKSCERK